MVSSDKLIAGVCSFISTCVVCAGAAQAAAIDLTGSLALSYAADDGSELPYRLYIPETVEAQRGNPLVLFLHGWAEKGTDNQTQLIQVDGLIEAARRNNSFLLAPQVPVGGHWLSDTVSVIGEILDLTQSQYTIDANRIYVTGFSMGGFGTLNAVLTLPDVFAAAVPMHSAVDPVLGPYLAHVPTWGFNGEFDDTAEMMAELLEVMDMAGLADIRYTELAGLGHSGWQDVYRDANNELYPWLFAQGALATPLPGAAPLLLTGLLALFGLRRRWHCRA